METVHFTQDDRKLLTDLNVDLKLLQQTVNTLNLSVGRLNAKLDGDVFMKKIDAMRIDADHETRLRRLETWVSVAIGGLLILQLGLQFFLK